MRRAIPLLLSAACSQAGLDLSLIDDVRVVAMVADPPEVGPGESATIRVTVADPLRRAPELMVWACTPVAGVCLESSYLGLPDRLALLATVNGTATYTQPIPELDLSDDAVFEPRLWALACAPGLCPIFDEARERLDRGASSAALEADLAHPESWMGDLPWDGVHLATHTYRASTAAEEDRNVNPVYEPRFPGGNDEQIEIAPGATLDVNFWSGDQNGDNVRAYAATTVGTFPDPDAEVDGNAARLLYVAPDQPQEGDIYVVFEDGHGGEALYRQHVVVR